jgi:hypothetical protein
MRNYEDMLLEQEAIKLFCFHKFLFSLLPIFCSATDTHASLSSLFKAAGEASLSAICLTLVLFY